MYVCMHVCTKSFLKTTTNSSCVCTHLANKADSDSDSEVLNCYEKASSAKVNWNKSEALWVGQGQLECLPQLPWDLRWGREGIKLLGIFLFYFFWVRQFPNIKLEGTVEKVCTNLSR